MVKDLLKLKTLKSVSITIMYQFFKYKGKTNLIFIKLVFPL